MEEGVKSTGFILKRPLNQNSEGQGETKERASAMFNHELCKVCELVR